MPTSERGRSAFFPSRRPLFFYITDRKQTDKSILSHIRSAIRAGVDFIQIREKGLTDRELFELTRRAVQSSLGTRCRILVNGRADLALAAGAHGVHLPSAGLRVSDLRPWLPERFLVGVSVHSVREASQAAALGSDYVLLGHVFPTESKRGLGPPLGLRTLARACRLLPIPVLALGGIRKESVRRVIEEGAAGIAGISLFQKTKAGELRKIIRQSCDRFE